MEWTTPVVPWSELEVPFSKRNELPGVSRFQSHYACYHNSSFASTEAEYLQARFNSPQGEMWLTVRLRINVAPAETALPIKKDRQFSPEFQVQVEVQSSQPITFEGTVHAFALNWKQKNELTVGLGEGSRLPRSVSDSLLAAACGKQPVESHPFFKGTYSVPVSIVFEPEVISSLPEEHVAKKIADVTFSKLELKRPSCMEPVYFLFAIAVGTSAAASDVSAVLFKPPTICIARNLNRNKATRKLGYLNPEEMYAAIKSWRGEAYKTKPNEELKLSSGQGKEAVEAGAAQYPGDLSVQKGADSTGNAQADIIRLVGQGRGTGAQTGSPLHHKFWGDAGGNRAVQSRPMDAATAAIFGHAAVSVIDPSPIPNSLKRSRPTVPIAAAPAMAAPDHQQQMQDGAAAACTRDRGHSFRVQSRPCDSMYQITDEGTHAQQDVGHEEKPTPLPFLIRANEEEGNDGPVATSFPHLEVSFDFGCLEAPPTSSMHANSTSREDATVPSTGAPSENLGATYAQMDVPNAADRGLAGALEASASGAISSATCGGLEAVYANVTDEDHTALQINQPAVARVPTVLNHN